MLIADPKCPFFCRQCASGRPDSVCWKCKAETIIPVANWENPRTPNLKQIVLLGRQVGYSIAVHGSMERDLDLIAVPWTTTADTPEVLIDHLKKGINAVQIGKTENKPHGRIAVTLQIDGYFKPIDLSIMPLSEPFHLERSMDDRSKVITVVKPGDRWGGTASLLKGETNGIFPPFTPPKKE